MHSGLSWILIPKVKIVNNIKYILGENDKLKNLRGKFYERHGAKILITYHPAALLRDPSKKKLVWEDMQIVMKEVGIDV